MARTDVIFVTGPGRSGTSALTKTLALCGAALPTLLYGADERNPRGFWEPVDAIALNDKFLSEHGSVAGEPTIMRGWGGSIVTQTEKVEFVSKIRNFLSTCPSASTLVVKDPRITALLEFWIEAAKAEGLSPKVVIAIRHPVEFLASIGASGEQESTAAGILYICYNLLAERYSRLVPRAVVDFEMMLSNWRREVARIVGTLSLNLNPTDEARIDEFLSPDLRRHRYSETDSMSAKNSYPWMFQVYETLHEAALGGKLDVGTLDRLYEEYSDTDAYQQSDQAFRLAWNKSKSVGSSLPPVSIPSLG